MSIQLEQIVAMTPPGAEFQTPLPQFSRERFPVTAHKSRE
jgi:hypothetical protein